MIAFKQVTGVVAVDDGWSSAQAFTGMQIGPSARTCVVVTMPGSKASIDVNGSNIELGAGSWLNVTSGIPRQARKATIGHSDWRTIVGRLWAKVNGDPHWDEDYDGGGGIRG